MNNGDFERKDVPGPGTCHSIHNSQSAKDVDEPSASWVRRMISGFRIIKYIKQFVRRQIENFCISLNAISFWLQHRILKQTPEKKRAEKNLLLPLSEMDQDLLGMYIRWNAHHTEKTVRYKKNVGRGHAKPQLLRNALDEWHRRGYPRRKWIEWAEENLVDYQIWNQSGEPQIHPEKELPAFHPASPIIDVLFNRVSTRFWKAAPVKDKIIKEIVTAGTYAPSSCNRQPWKLYIRRNLELEETSRLPGVSNETLIDRAPVVIYITIDNRFYPEVWAPALDAGIIGLQLSLAATANGLAGCLMYGAENFDQEEFRRLYNVPKYQFMYLLFLFGYPAERTLTEKRSHPDDISIYV
ncbi:MAG: nitroreductase family protein [Desulfobacteraceae bacterium]|nr:nitroreductase family protein [Desulfobacteraceae bacterium]MBC2754814.1 nitroreductase family protein [Desulfobacteraceae bacterium]